MPTSKKLKSKPTKTTKKTPTLDPALQPLVDRPWSVKRPKGWNIREHAADLIVFDWNALAPGKRGELASLVSDDTATLVKREKWVSTEYVPVGVLGFAPFAAAKLLPRAKKPIHNFNFGVDAHAEVVLMQHVKTGAVYSAPGGDAYGFEVKLVRLAASAAELVAKLAPVPYDGDIEEGW